LFKRCFYYFLIFSEEEEAKNVPVVESPGFGVRQTWWNPTSVTRRTYFIR
jgi:hypothetical protein